MAAVYEDWDLLRQVDSAVNDLSKEFDVPLPRTDYQTVADLEAECQRFGISFAAGYASKSEGAKIKYLKARLYVKRGEQFKLLFERMSEAKRPLPTKCGELWLRLWVDARPWKFGLRKSSRGEPCEAQIWPNETGKIDGELVKNRWFRAVDNHHKEDVAEDVAFEVFLATCRNAGAWHAQGVVHNYTNPWWGFVKRQLPAIIKAAVLRTGYDDGTRPSTLPMSDEFANSIPNSTATGEPLNIVNLVASLEPVEREVLRLKYSEDPPKTYAEIGLLLELTAHQVSQIHHCALKKLRSWLSDAGEDNPA